MGDVETAEEDFEGTFHQFEWSDDYGRGAGWEATEFVDEEDVQGWKAASQTRYKKWETGKVYAIQGPNDYLALTSGDEALAVGSADEAGFQWDNERREVVMRWGSGDQQYLQVIPYSEKEKIDKYLRDTGETAPNAYQDSGSSSMVIIVAGVAALFLLVK